MRRTVTAAISLCLLLAGIPVPARAAGNSPPVAVDDPGVACGSSGVLATVYPVPEDWHEPALLAIGCAPLVNDTDADGDPLTVSLVGQPLHGQASVVPGTPSDWLTYLPDHDYSTPVTELPSDVITYRAFDGQDYSNEASYRIWVAPVNDPPTFTPGPLLVETHAGAGPVSIPWATSISPGPANEHGQAVHFELYDSAPDDAFEVKPAIDDDGNLTFTPGTQPWLVTVVVNAKDDGGLEDWNLPASAPFDQPDDTSDPVTMQIAIYPSPPTAVDDSFTVDEDASDYVGVTANDINRGNGALKIVDLSTPAKGTVSTAMNGPEWTIFYKPSADVNGSDEFTYTIEDGEGNREQATVHVTITPLPDAPVAVDDSVTVGFESEATPIHVLDNDRDADGDVLVATAAGLAAHGITTVVDGLPSYRPDAGFTGTDSFSYTVADPGGLTASATVHVSVSADGVPPVVAGLATTIAGGKVDGGRVPVRVSWHASDVGTGVASSTVQERQGSGGWHAVQLPVPTATTIGRGIFPGVTIGYRVRATDKAGNVGPFATTAATTALLGEGSSAIHWSGDWTRVRDARLTDAHARVARAAGRKVTLAFTGQEIAWIGQVGANLGRAEVRIDGELVATVSLRADATSRRRVVFHAALQAGGSHRIEIRTLGSRAVVVDGFAVLR
ncbi:MAG TPA: Ig-like domain-containing protein [Candidatus Limnocylindrales bacterium]